MFHVSGGGGSVEWQNMNSENIRLVNDWQKSNETRCNVGRGKVGVLMVEVCE